MIKINTFRGDLSDISAKKTLLDSTCAGLFHGPIERGMSRRRRGFGSRGVPVLPRLETRSRFSYQDGVYNTYGKPSLRLVPLAWDDMSETVLPFAAKYKMCFWILSSRK